MFSTTRLILFSWITCFIVTANCSAQSRPLPFYSLPKDGSWVEFDWEMTRGNQKSSGKLRIASAGREKIQGVAYRWIEVKNTVNQKPAMRKDLRRILVKEDTFNAQDLSPTHVLRGYLQRGDGPIREMSRSELTSFLQMGFSGDNLTFKQINKQEIIATAVGKLTAKHVRSESGTKNNIRKYDGWLSTKIPFGLARFEVREFKNGKSVQEFKAVLSSHHKSKLK